MSAWQKKGCHWTVELMSRWGKVIDLRVSTLPTVHGESIVMRILDKESLSLGLPQPASFRMTKTFSKSHQYARWYFLVTGPTGSGKSTTLYSALHAINKPDRKIITVEDPVEYEVPGINQVQVRTEVGMTFSAALRKRCYDKHLTLSWSERFGIWRLPKLPSMHP